MKNKEIKGLWEVFIKEYEEYLLDDAEKWKLNLDKVKDYMDKHKRRPRSRDKNSEIKQLGSWISAQRTRYKKQDRCMKSKEFRKIWEAFIEEYKEYFLDNNTIWKSNLEKVKKYIDEHKKRPSTLDKNNDIKTLSAWLSTNPRNYKKQEYIMKDEEIRKIWEAFIKEYEEYVIDDTEIWKLQLEKAKNYIDINKKRPSNKDKRTLCGWINKQQNNYRGEQIGCMKDKEIKGLWESFIKEYEEYLLDYIEIWKLQLEKAKNYIDINKKRPLRNDKNNDIKTLSAWIGTQLQNYKKLEHCMKDKEIKGLWEAFIENYEEYLLDNRRDICNKYL